MVKMKISLDDIGWLRKYYPGLRIKNGDTITGILRFRAKMKTKSKPPLTKPPEIEIWHEYPGSVQGRYYVEDRYEIEGYINEILFPCFKEIGGRLEAHASAIGKPIIDLHIFPDTKEFCLGHPGHIFSVMKQDNSIQHFFEKLLIPYLYYHSYWQKYGIEPWRGFQHGDAGILEGMGDYKSQMNDLNFIDMTCAHLSETARSKIYECIVSGSEISRNDICFCGSGKKVKECCRERAMKGFKILTKVIRKAASIPSFESHLFSCV